MYMITMALSIISLKIVSIIDWKVASELHIPKNITVGSNNPLLVLKVAFHWSPSQIWILLYPHHMSSLVKHLVPLSLSSNSFINGSGYTFSLCVHLDISSPDIVIISHPSCWQRRRVRPLEIVMVRCIPLENCPVQFVLPVSDYMFWRTLKWMCLWVQFYGPTIKVQEIELHFSLRRHLKFMKLLWYLVLQRYGRFL